MRYGCVLWLVFTPLAHSDPLQNCLAQRRPSSDQWNPALHCPQLMQQLGSNTDLLTEPALDQALSPTQLNYLQRQTQPANRSFALQREALNALLAQRQATPEPSKNALWQTFLDWLNQLKHGDYEQQYQWLSQWLAALTPSEQTARLLLYGLLGMLVLMSLGMVAFELQQAGWWLRVKNRMQAKTTRDQVLHATVTTALSECAQLSGDAPRQQLAAVLERAVETLITHYQITANRADTYRQVVARLDQRLAGWQTLQRLLDHAEPLLYGRDEPSPAQLVNLRDEAQHLLKQLHA